LQGRFKHLFKAGNENLLAEIQTEVDQDWENLKALCDFHSKQGVV
jgi:pyruvate ferredoxin oxidoreductase beta subunit